MKKFFYLMAAATLATGLTSCNKSMMLQNSPVYSLTNSNVTNGILQTKLESKGELKGEVSGKFSLFGGKLKRVEQKYVMDNSHIRKLRGMNAAKAAALYKALEGSGCDIVLAPIYNVTTKGRKFTVKVSGIGAVIKDVEQLKTIAQ